MPPPLRFFRETPRRLGGFVAVANRAVLRESTVDRIARSVERAFGTIRLVPRVNDAGKQFVYHVGEAGARALRRLKRSREVYE